MSILYALHSCERSIVFPNVAKLAKLAIIFNSRKGGDAETALLLAANLNILVRLASLATIPTELIHRAPLNGLDVQKSRIKPALWMVLMWTHRIAKYSAITLMRLCTKSTKHHTFNYQLRIHSDNAL